MEFTIRHGLEVPVAGAPKQTVDGQLEVSSVALSTIDFHGIRPEVIIKQGQKVALGQPLFRDRNRPEIVFTAPVAGLVSEINRGHHRSLDSIVVNCAGDKSVSFDTSGNIRSVLLESGLWPAFKTRPYGHIPDPEAQAEAILVTAIDSNPLAADPAIILKKEKKAFARGLEVLAKLQDAPVIVCQGVGPKLVQSQSEHIRCATFKGRHPSGLSGTHLQLLGLSGKYIWQAGYQDVIAIGHLFLTGKLATDRVISLAGPMIRNPRLVRVKRGANIDELLQGEVLEGNFQAISGSVLTGRKSAHLGFYDLQLSVLSKARRRIWNRLFSRSNENSTAPIIPTEAFERVLPQSILPIPLMRALSVGDWETAAKLGCLNLLEEDVAPLSYLCSSGNDYSALLRLALDDFAGAS